MRCTASVGDRRRRVKGRNLWGKVRLTDGPVGQQQLNAERVCSVTEFEGRFEALRGRADRIYGVAVVACVGRAAIQKRGCDSKQVTSVGPLVCSLCLLTLLSLDSLSTECAPPPGVVYCADVSAAEDNSKLGMAGQSIARSRGRAGLLMVLLH